VVAVADWRQSGAAHHQRDDLREHRRDERLGLGLESLGDAPEAGERARARVRLLLVRTRVEDGLELRVRLGEVPSLGGRVGERLRGGRAVLRGRGRGERGEIERHSS